jgi:hypothetical protein
VRELRGKMEEDVPDNNQHTVPDPVHMPVVDIHLRILHHQYLLLL